jgi:putative ATP-dependent endonuclease of OLD family
VKLHRIEIRNFRGIESLDLDIEDITVLIGENNTCKTSILEALRFSLHEVRSRRGCVFEPFDFHLLNSSSNPSDVPSISIKLIFDIVDEKIKRKLSLAKLTQVARDGKTQVIFKVGASYNQESQDFVQNWEFQNTNGESIPNLSDTALTTFQNTISYFYLSALRDASRQFDAKGAFWRPFLKSAQITSEQQKEIETKLEELNHLIIDSHKSLNDVITVLKDIDQIVPMSNENLNWISVEAVPGRIFDMLAKAQVNLNAQTVAKIPVTRHGEGTQSLAVLMLFKAYLHAWNKGYPIIALEEPEAHLHPSAIRSLWKIIEDLPGQKIVSTHSGDILSEVPSDSIVRLSRNQSKIVVHKLKDANLDKDDSRKFNYKIKSDRGSLLFARCWILGEGQTEATIIPEAAKLLGYDFEQIGIRIVGYQEDLSLKTALSVANILGIQWVILSDNDKMGTSTHNTVTRYINERNENESDVLFLMQEKNIEKYLSNNGFASIYASKNKEKTQAAQEIVAAMNKNNIPPLIKNVIEAAVRFAKGE